MAEPAPQEPTPSPASGPSEPHIRVENLTKRFAAKEVLKDISLGIPRGKTTVILGGSGAGKTTFMRLLIGLEKPTSGHIFVDGEDMVGGSSVKLNRIRRKFGMVFQYAALLDSLTVFENVAFPLREHTRMTEREIAAEVTAKLEILGLAGTQRRFPSELSGGMRKRVGIARALILHPEILIYDEPTSGLDPHTSRLVDDLIEEMRSRFQVTSIVISHDMASTFRIAHNVALLVGGRIAVNGTPEEILADTSELVRSFIAASGVDPARVGRAQCVPEGGSPREAGA